MESAASLSPPTKFKPVMETLEKDSLAPIASLAKDSVVAQGARRKIPCKPVPEQMK